MSKEGILSNLFFVKIERSESILRYSAVGNSAVCFLKVVKRWKGWLNRTKKMFPKNFLRFMAVNQKAASHP